ncbi:MAG: hypothetical protein ACJ8FY_02865 [Gemmataceae bacterium]
MTQAAQYFIAQHIPDLFRQEQKNVGVFVNKDGKIAARFAGETAIGNLDRRKLKGMSFPDVYAQWVEHWRRVIGGPDRNWKESLLESHGHYRVLDAGEVTDTGIDKPEAIADYLYSLLVSEGGLTEALGLGEEVEAAIAQLKDEITEQLRVANVFGDSSIFAQHPVRRDVAIQGTVSQPHKPAFVQENGSLHVMETVDFTTRTKERAKDHAGWAAYMFDDIRKSLRNLRLHAISIVRSRPEDEDNENVSYAMSMLKSESDEVVNWLDKGDRSRFIQERIKVSQA